MKTIKLNVSTTNSSINYNNINEVTNNADNITYRIQVVDDTDNTNAEIGNVNVSVNINLYDTNSEYSEVIENLRSKIKTAFDGFNSEIIN